MKGRYIALERFDALVAHLEKMIDAAPEPPTGKLEEDDLGYADGYISGLEMALAITLDEKDNI